MRQMTDSRPGRLLSRPLTVLFALCLVGSLLLTATVALAASGSQSPITQSSTPTARYPIGNYCLECHISVPAQPLAGVRPVTWARDIPCATLRKAQEEIYQIDTLVAATQNAADQLRRQGFDTSTPVQRLDARRVAVARLTETDAVALSAISGQARTIRYQMNKTYQLLQEQRAERQRLWVIGWAVAGTLFLLTGIALGWRNTLKGQGRRQLSPATLIWLGIALVVVFVLFATPIFSWGPPLPAATAEETERQAAVDQASRVSDAATRLSAQGWVLARIGARWSALDKAQGEVALAAALQAAEDKMTAEAAYWGQAQAVRESAVAWRASTQDLATFRSDRIAATAAQTWPYRAVAVEWLSVDKNRATDLLAMALTAVANTQYPTPIYRDLDLRAIAVVWARLDPAKGRELVGQVNDPLLRAWGYREIGDLLKPGDLSDYVKAVEAARQIQNPYDRAWALRAIAQTFPDPTPLSAFNGVTLLNEAAEAAARIEAPETRAYALADVAIALAGKDASKALDLAGKIDTAYPEARVMAWQGIGNRLAGLAAPQAKTALDQALAEAKTLDNTYLANKFTATILSDYARLDPAAALNLASNLTDGLSRDQVYLNISRVLAATNRDQAARLAAQIGSPALRLQSLTAIGTAWAQAGDKAKAAAAFQEAFALTDRLEETAPLRDLAIAWATLDPQAALVVVDKLTDNADKTAALQAIALALAQTDKTQSAQVFERAMNVAKSVRLTGEAFAAARALTNLAAAYAPVDAGRANQAFALALDVARRVNVKY